MIVAEFSHFTLPVLSIPWPCQFRDVFEACLNTPPTAGALGAPPAPPSKVDGSDCSVCDPGTVADPSGIGCVPECPADVVVDAGTLGQGTSQAFNAGISAPGDTCPEVFVLRVENHGALFGGTASTSISLRPTPVSDMTCPGIYELTSVLTKASAPTTTITSGTGVWTPCSGFGCPEPCQGTPTLSVLAADADVAAYQTSTNNGREIAITIPTIIE